MNSTLEQNLTTAHVFDTTSDHRLRIKHSMEQAQRYLHRPQKKHLAEMALIEKALDYLRNQPTPPKSFLDAPCGVGRATVFLAEKGYQTTGVDLGVGAVHFAQEQVKKASIDATIESADLLDLPFTNAKFDAVLCFRLFHHLPTPTHRQEIVDELCRVAKNQVIVSYISPWAYTSCKRLARQYLLGKKSAQHITPLDEVENYFTVNGFKLIKNFAQTPLIHSLHLAVFRREDR